MKTVFADTVYWVAILKPNDPWPATAVDARSQLGPTRIVTTDEVLTEFVTLLAGSGPILRGRAVEMVRTILGDPNVKVFPQSRDSFLKGMTRYAQREDKTYGLVDCIPMDVIESERVQEVLTNDHHFEQEGFVVLMRRPPP